MEYRIGNREKSTVGFEKINKTDNFLARLFKKKRKKI